MDFINRDFRSLQGCVYIRRANSVHVVIGRLTQTRTPRSRPTFSCLVATLYSIINVCVLVGGGCGCANMEHGWKPVALNYYGLMLIERLYFGGGHN